MNLAIGLAIGSSRLTGGGGSSSADADFAYARLLASNPSIQGLEVGSGFAPLVGGTIAGDVSAEYLAAINTLGLAPSCLTCL